VEHIISAGHILERGKNVKRCNIVFAQLHFNICYEIGVELDNKHWYDHISKSVKTSHEFKVTLLWNQQVQTNRTIPNNKLNITMVIINKEYAC